MARSAANTTTNTTASRAANNGGGLLTKYFLVILLMFGFLTLLVNTRFTAEVVDDVSMLEVFLSNSMSTMAKKIREDGVPSSDDTPPQKEEGASKSSDTISSQDDAGGLSSTDDTSPQKEAGASESIDASSSQDDAGGSEKADKKIPASNHHALAGLSCDKFGGPSKDIAAEMVYWEDIQEDSKYVSPFKRSTPQYMTFEPDAGGWNNIRMAMETVLAMAFAMGRTLVLPPEQRLYLLSKDERGKQRNTFGFNHFFHMESISNEHHNFDIITMQEYLEREAMTGNLKNAQTGQVSFPPNNRTSWDGCSGPESNTLKQWLRSTAKMVLWDPQDCMAVFPKTKDPANIQELIEMKKQVDQSGGFPSYEAYVGKPFPVDASPIDRMKENWAGRKDLCIYGEDLQAQPLVHFPVGKFKEVEARLLVHFYAFLFFQDWKEDLWMKRFVRDHIRYIDEIQCAAARVVHGVRERARKRHPDTNPDGDFDTFHVRRGDFQYTVTRATAEEILEMAQKKLMENSTVYIATDERDRSFFNVLKDHYDVVFLEDFAEELQGVNTNFYGMIDQLVASRGRIFFGCWFSTFTGYINRLRGYHADDHQTPGYKDGIVPSYYYALRDRFLHMQKFQPVKQSFYAREFPTSWRLIDTGVGG